MWKGENSRKFASSRTRVLRKGDADDVCEGKIREVETAFRKFRIGEKVDERGRE